MSSAVLAVCQSMRAAVPLACCALLCKFLMPERGASQKGQCNTAHTLWTAGTGHLSKQAISPFALTGSPAAVPTSQRGTRKGWRPALSVGDTPLPPCASRTCEKKSCPLDS